jgi:hypothetical protein
MSDSNAITIRNIPSHAKFFTMKMQAWLVQLDRIADGGKSDGRFTARNFRFLKNHGYYYLKRNHPNALFLKRFGNFAKFRKFVTSYIKSQGCSSPYMIRELRKVNKGVEDPDRAFCVAPHQPSLPPMPPPPRIKPRKPHVAKTEKKIVPIPDPMSNVERLTLTLNLMLKNRYLIESYLNTDRFKNISIEPPKRDLPALDWWPGKGPCGCIRMGPIRPKIAKDALKKRVIVVGPGDEGLKHLLNQAQFLNKKVHSRFPNSITAQTAKPGTKCLSRGCV